MRSSLRSIATLALLASMTGLVACNPPEKKGGTTAADVAEGATAEGSSIDKSVGELFNGAKPTAVAETAWPGVYEVIVNGGVYYANKDGRFMISGEMLEVDGKKNLTANARDRIRADLMVKLDEKDAIIYKAKGEKKEVLHVFTDVECGYCREFHKNIEAYNKMGYEIHYYPWPRSGTSGPVYDEMVSVWCASGNKGKQSALTQAKAGKKPASKTCENPVDEYVELGRQMGIQGTPAIFLDSGKQIGGYVPPENIGAAIDGAKGQPTAPPAP